MCSELTPRARIPDTTTYALHHWSCVISPHKTLLVKPTYYGSKTKEQTQNFQKIAHELAPSEIDIYLRRRKQKILRLEVKKGIYMKRRLHFLGNIGTSRHKRFFLKTCTRALRVFVFELPILWGTFFCGCGLFCWWRWHLKYKEAMLNIFCVCAFLYSLYERNVQSQMLQQMSQKVWY